MNRIERIHKMDEMLAQHGTVPVDAFLSTLKISLATFKRDLDYLRSHLHAPVVWDRTRGGYSYGKRRSGKSATSPMPSLWAGARETHALLTAHSILSSLKSGSLKAEADGLCARILALLSANGDSPAQIARRLGVTDVPATVQDHPLFPALASAVLKRRRIRLSAAVGRRKTPEQLLLSPQTLHCESGEWILDALDHADGRVRQIALSACESVEVLNEKARDASLRTARAAA